MNHIVRPHIPYRGPIPGGLHEGKLIEIKGHVPYGADVFTVNFLTGLDEGSDRPLHISVRFHGRVVVRNALEQNCWGPEERHGLFPFQTGHDFIMVILVNPDCYRIAVNNQHCWEFPHRIPISRVTSILIDGSVKIERIEFIDKITPYQQPGTCVPPAMPFPPSVPIIPSVPVYPEVGNGGCFVPGIQPSIGIQPAVCPAVSARLDMQPSSNLPPVYNPIIPYAYPIYGGLKPDMLIYISGRPTACPYKFTINLQSGTSPYPPPDIAFHFDVRFYNYTVIRNSFSDGQWHPEEKEISHFPFQPAVNFDMIIKVEHDKYMVALNGQHFLEFRHRLTPLSRFDTLCIENDIVVSSIRFG